MAERIRQPWVVLTAMFLFQTLWLAAKWLSGNTSLWLLSRSTSTWRTAPLLFVGSTVAYVVLLTLPGGFRSRLTSAWTRLVQDERGILILITLLTLGAGAIYAANQVVWYDEERLFDASKLLAEEGTASFFAEYLRLPWLGRQHPPLVPLLYGAVLDLFGPHLVVLRLVSLVFSVGAALTTYFLGKVLYNQETGLLGALLLLTIPYFLRLGSAARTDMVALFLFLLAILLVLRLLERPAYGLAVGSGVVIGLGLLSRYTVVFVYPVLLGYAVVQRSLRKCWFHLAVVALASLAILAPWLVYAARSGILTAHMDTLAYFGGVSTSSTGATSWDPILGRHALRQLVTGVPSALGGYQIPLLLLGSVTILRVKRPADGLLLLWVATVFVLLILTHPTARYLMPIYPALALVAAQAVSTFEEGSARVVLLALLYCGGMLYMYVGG